MPQVLSACSFSFSLFFCVSICIPGGSSPAGQCRVFPHEAPAPATLVTCLVVGGDPGKFCASYVAFDSCLSPLRSIGL